ncbi:MAG: beta-lactamase family protein [Candidatus Heimdallarchaeota archaeon]|nr:MAG: beta-lactamase family protein [Candidatus Heimdallarchaeota archaeon]
MFIGIVFSSSFTTYRTSVNDPLFHTLSNKSPYSIAQDLSNLTDVRLFFDDFITQQKIASHILGAHICLVKDGAIYYSNGYGSFDNSNGVRVPVMVNTTLFRVGSLSKAVTATAIMQLVEQDLIDLNVDVNDYLDTFKVPATFPEPITVTHLLSHTSGLQNTLAPVYLTTDENLPTLEEVIRAELPKRIIPPGQAAMYSNFGYALLGYIVELVSGMPFPDYIRSAIFNPLGMNNSYFERVLPEEALDHLSSAYHYSAHQGYVLGSSEYATMSPAAGLITTAEDYGRFLIAHLNNGTYNKNRILQNETVQLMHQVHFEARPRMDGVCYGFYERDMNGLEMIGHGGITYWFQATEVMLLEENVGLYVCYNTDSAGAAGAELVEAFMDRYYPASKVVTPLEGFEERVDKYVGKYLNSHALVSSAQKMRFLSGFPTESMHVTANQDGSIRVQRISSPSSYVSYDNVFVEVEPGLFLDKEGSSNDIVAFLEDDNGVMTHMYFSWFPPEAWVRRSFPVSVAESLTLIEFISLSGLIIFPLYILVDLRSLWKYQLEETRLVQGLRLLSIAGAVVAFLMLLFQVQAILLFLVVVLLIPLLALSIIAGFLRKWEIENFCSVTRFMSTLQFSLLIPAFFMLNEGSRLWGSLINTSGEPATWFELQASYHFTMAVVFGLIAAYLIAVIVYALLVGFAWTKRGGFDRTSPANIGERVLYTLLIIIAIIITWLLSLWGAFGFLF